MKNKQKVIEFNLLDIKIDQFAILEGIYNPKKEIGLSTSLQFKISEENKQLGCFLEIEYTQLKKVFLKIAVSGHFEIENKSWETLTNTAHPSLSVPKDFLAHLAMITVGTTRGILYAKTEGSIYSKFIVPIMNVAAMIPEDVSFELIKTNG